MASTPHGGQVDFSTGDVRRGILDVAAPMLVAQVLNLLYNIVDRIYIGKIPGESTLALAGLGLCFPHRHAGHRLCQPVRGGRGAALLHRPGPEGR